MSWSRAGFIAVVFSVASASFAAAQTAAYIYTALGYQQITALITTPATLTVPAASRAAQICAESSIVRYRDDGTAPTATVGMPIAAGTCIFYSGPLTALQFIEAASPATLDVSYYR